MARLTGKGASAARKTAKKRKTLAGGGAGAVPAASKVKSHEKPTSKPQCALHGKEMVYRLEDGVWRCTVDGCPQFAWPRRDVKKGQPIIGKGDLELVVMEDSDGEEHVLLRASGNNVYIEVTDKIKGSVQTSTLGPYASVTLETLHYTTGQD